MNTGRTKLFIGLLTAAFLCAAAPDARAQVLDSTETARLAAYEIPISTGNPVSAALFLADSAFIDRLRLVNPDKAAELTAKAQAIQDLESLMDRTWRNTQELELSQALSIRIDFNKPLEKVGIGPAPEGLLSWMARYKRYSAHKLQLTRKAIREFEVVFGTAATAGKAQWVAFSIRERNSFLSDKASGALESLIMNETRTDKAFRDEVAEAGIFRYLDAAGRARFERYMNQLETADAAKARLNTAQLNRIKDLPIEQQMYMLGSVFDRSTNRGAVSLERRIDSARESRPGETLSFQENQLLSGMLRTAMVSEVRGTAAGNRILAFYNSGATLNIAIESCRGCYAKYEPAANRIVIDSELVRQYMRINNISADTLMKSRTHVAALARYVSPMFVHEATHQMQHSWADTAGIYKPYVQEDEIEAGSMEALYTTEKMRRDNRFKELFLRMENNTVYAQKRLEMMNRFNEGPARFETMMRQVYYYGTPSFEAAASQIISLISSELERRYALPASELSAIETGGTDLARARRMTAAELNGAVRNIKTSALRGIREDLMNRSAYTGHYSETSNWCAARLAAVRGAGGGSVPAP